MPTLYLVGTPIGNLEDVTLRALRVLKEVGLIAAEDTRRARILMQRYEIETPLTSYHEQGRGSSAASLVRQLADKDIALISEAGMPSVSDPGFALVREALGHGFRVEVVPGPSVATAAVAVSGLPSNQFVFLGFLPRTTGKRRRFLESVQHDPRTLIVLEAPHRIRESLADIADLFGERPIAVCRELTKLHEEVYRGTVAGASAHFDKPKGEFTLVIGGSEQQPAPLAEDEVRERLLALRAQGLSGKDVVTQVSGEAGRPRKEVYRYWIEIQEETEDAG